MLEIFRQLGIDSSFFVQLGVFIATLMLLSRIFFNPFLRLIENRYKRTTQDREAAQKLMQQAENKLQEYQRLMGEARAEAQKNFEQVLKDARQHETQALHQAREEAKKITQEAAQEAAQEAEKIREKLRADVKTLATELSEKLLLRH